ncbi:MAG: YeeE/YedE family protein [Labilithrix sp.]|nr:YeeE/YedE family protein [Labilithrix sp.]MBX3221681.1 YeeE/YedE family protein [Labilithrix sp.]
MSGEESARADDPRLQALIAFGCGLLFAIGLGLAGMTSPAKVLAFLDVTSAAWDPSLAFVMAGAIGVHFVFARRAVAANAAGRRPVAGTRFFLPEPKAVDRALLGGAALFGAGWGLGGYCPGPALVAFVVTPVSVVFVGAMLAGMLGTRAVRERIAARAADRAQALANERALEREARG